MSGQMVLKSSTRVPRGAQLSITETPSFVSRGGEKLEAAIQAFGMDELHGLVCVDVGASTGGFTDCLLQHGVSRVYAVDVGYGVLHWKLRNDERVVLMERTNARYIEGFPEPIQLVTIDASFISLRILLPVVCGWFNKTGGIVIVLVKPQFEAGRSEAAKGKGVIRNPLVHRQVLLDVLGFSQETGLGVTGLIRSPLIGPKGNVEFLACLQYPGQPGGQELENMVEEVINL